MPSRAIEMLANTNLGSVAVSMLGFDKCDASRHSNNNNMLDSGQRGAGRGRRHDGTPDVRTLELYSVCHTVRHTFSESSRSTTGRVVLRYIPDSSTPTC